MNGAEIWLYNFPESGYESVDGIVESTFGSEIEIAYYDCESLDDVVRALITPKVIGILVDEKSMEECRKVPQSMITQKIVYYVNDTQFRDDFMELFEFKTLKEMGQSPEPPHIPTRPEPKHCEEQSIKQLPEKIDFEKWDQVHFCFCGSDYSLRNSYGRLKEELNRQKVFSTTGCLLLDLSYESYAEYFFEIQDIKEGMDCLMTKGEEGVEKYSSITSDEDVHYFSACHGILDNKNYQYLDFDWNGIIGAALNEFDEVYFFFGSISDPVNRIIFDSLLTSENGVSVFQSGDHLSVVYMLNSLRNYNSKSKISIQIFDLLKYDEDEPDQDKKDLAKKANEIYKIAKKRFPKTTFIQ